MENKSEKQRFSTGRRMLSFKYAIRGISHMMTTQHNAWIHLAISVIVVIAGVWFELSPAEWVLIVLNIGLVFAAEAFNTAIEMLVDKIAPDFDPVAGRIKDVAAGGVLISALVAVVVGVIIFLPKIVG